MVHRLRAAAPVAATAFCALILFRIDHTLVPAPGSLCDVREPFVCPDCRVLKFPGLLARRRRSLPLELPRVSFEERARYYAHGLARELGKLAGGQLQRLTVQFGIDLNRHAAILPPRDGVLTSGREASRGW